MLMYWLMFLVTASMALFTGQSRRSNLLPFIFVGFFFAIIIGLRYKVGGDWSNYIYHYTQTIRLSFDEAMSLGKDPAHQFLNWLMGRWDWGVYGINVIYGSIFMIGLIKFSRQQMYPWLAMIAAVPYLIIVVVMGYSRQGMAIGLFLWAITYLRKGQLKTYVVLVLIAALFHKSAIILLPLGMFLYGKGKLLRILMIVPLAYGAWDILFSAAQSNLIYQYIDKDMQSSGAKIRVAMNFLPAILLLIYRKQWKKDFNDYIFWYWIAMGSIIAVGLVGVASTAVDRISLYFIPLQLAVYARLPYLARNKISPAMMKVMIVLGYAAVLFIWLFFGAHSYAWVPYQNLLWLGIF